MYYMYNCRWLVDKKVGVPLVQVHWIWRRGWWARVGREDPNIMKFHRNTSWTSLTKDINGLVDMQCPTLHGKNLLLGFFGSMTTQFIVRKGFNKVHKCSPNVLKTTFIAIKLLVWEIYKLSSLNKKTRRKSMIQPFH